MIIVLLTPESLEFEPHSPSFEILFLRSNENLQPNAGFENPVVMNRPHGCMFDSLLITTFLFYPALQYPTKPLTTPLAPFTYLATPC